VEVEVQVAVHSIPKVEGAKDSVLTTFNYEKGRDEGRDEGGDEGGEKGRDEGGEEGGKKGGYFVLDEKTKSIQTPECTYCMVEGAEQLGDFYTALTEGRLNGVEKLRGRIRVQEGRDGSVIFTCAVKYSRRDGLEVELELRFIPRLRAGARPGRPDLFESAGWRLRHCVEKLRRVYPEGALGLPPGCEFAIDFYPGARPVGDIEVKTGTEVERHRALEVALGRLLTDGVVGARLRGVGKVYMQDYEEIPKEMSFGGAELGERNPNRGQFNELRRAGAEAAAGIRAGGENPLRGLLAAIWQPGRRAPSSGNEGSWRDRGGEGGWRRRPGAGSDYRASAGRHYSPPRGRTPDREQDRAQDRERDRERDRDRLGGGRRG
jgi:hypothetical protein